MSNQGFYQLDLRTVEDQSIGAIDGFIRFFEAPTPTRTLFRYSDLRFPPVQQFTLPVYPEIKTKLVCEINDERFRITTGEPFTLKGNETKSKRIKLFRRPSEWTAKFESWEGLGTEFKRLKQVLQNSPNIKVIGGGSLGSFTGAAYDELSTQKGILAKTCLLNLYFKMSEDIEPVGREYPWFKFVRQIVEFGRERFIAVVEDEMSGIVQTIKDNIKSYPLYNPAGAGLHYKNIPAGFTVKEGDLFSIKSDEDHGNIQLTIGPAVDSQGQKVTLLDVDIDENKKLMKHLADLFKHKFNGGTHPYDIHEYLETTYPGNSFGYNLVEV